MPVKDERRKRSNWKKLAKKTAPRERGSSG
jgi:hypothetical protein